MDSTFFVVFLIDEAASDARTNLCLYLKVSNFFRSSSGNLRMLVDHHQGSRAVYSYQSDASSIFF